MALPSSHPLQLQISLAREPDSYHTPVSSITFHPLCLHPQLQSLRIPAFGASVPKDAFLEKALEHCPDVQFFAPICLKSGMVSIMQHGAETNSACATAVVCQSFGRHDEEVKAHASYEKELARYRPLFLKRTMKLSS